WVGVTNGAGAPNSSGPGHHRPTGLGRGDPALLAGDVCLVAWGPGGASSARTDPGELACQQSCRVVDYPADSAVFTVVAGVFGRVAGSAKLSLAGLDDDAERG